MVVPGLNKSANSRTFFLLFLQCLCFFATEHSLIFCCLWDTLMVGFHRLPGGKVKKADGFWRHAAGPKILALNIPAGWWSEGEHRGGNQWCSSKGNRRTQLSQVKGAAPVENERRGEGCILIVNIWRCWLAMCINKVVPAAPSHGCSELGQQINTSAFHSHLQWSWVLDL